MNFQIKMAQKMPGPLHEIAHVSYCGEKRERKGEEKEEISLQENTFKRLEMEKTSGYHIKTECWDAMVFHY